MTTIEWTQRPGTKGESWNPIRARNKETGGVGHFCEHVSEGCRNCYAERLQPRFRNPIRYAAQDRAKVEIVLDEAKLEAPLRWRKPRTVFVCSMSDLFGDWVEDAWLDRIFAVMALTPQHTYQVLTKRPERMQDYVGQGWARNRRHALLDTEADGLARCLYPQDWPWPLPNLWLGVSVEDQATADQRIPLLLDTPAAVRFVSYEPALGPVNFECIELAEPKDDHLYIDALNGHGLYDEDGGNLGCDEFAHNKLDWIIAGGESGPKARPTLMRWFLDVRDQCEDADVPFFFKQWGGATHGAGGRLLDGREHSAWPR